LSKEIEKGKFREDLYHRLAVILVKVPSLKERKKDIPQLVDYFTENLIADQGLDPKTFSKGAVNQLMDYPWTGNIRELKNVIERLMILGSNPVSREDIQKFAAKPKL
jgi:DNA-binding NtrC family response regulator